MDARHGGEFNIYEVAKLHPAKPLEGVLKKETGTEVPVSYRCPFKGLLPTVPTIGIPDTVRILQNETQRGKRLWW